MPYHSATRRPGGRSTNSSFRRSNNARRPAKRRGATENIDPRRLVKPAKPREEVQYEAKHTFADFNLHPIIKANVQASGFTAPSPIQDQTIPYGLEGRDVIGIANTGTGKTAAFALPLLTKLLESKEHRALIMAPTRELAQQIEDACRAFASGSGIRGALLIGGTAMGPQLRDLRELPQIVIGTPGRIKDHAERRTLMLHKFDIVVLDEVDRMLDMGFVNDMRDILGQLAKPRQSFFFSATLDHKVRQLIEDFSIDPVTVSVKTGDTSENVDQNIVHYGSSHEKLERLHETLLSAEIQKVLVFDETKRSVERLSEELVARGFKADAIHGGRSQSQRQRSLDRFKRSDIKILVATDVAARGIDVADITHVINYSMPNTYDDYVHRIGRAGRAGRTGFALTFVERRNIQY